MQVRNMISKLGDTNRNCVYRSCIESHGPSRVSDPPRSYHNQGVVPFQETSVDRYAEEAP